MDPNTGTLNLDPDPDPGPDPAKLSILKEKFLKNLEENNFL